MTVTALPTKFALSLMSCRRILARKITTPNGKSSGQAGSADNEDVDEQSRSHIGSRLLLLTMNPQFDQRFQIP